jgi:hypothetical protein
MRRAALVVMRRAALVVMRRAALVVMRRAALVVMRRAALTKICVGWRSVGQSLSTIPLRPRSPSSSQYHSI